MCEMLVNDLRAGIEPKASMAALEVPPEASWIGLIRLQDSRRDKWMRLRTDGLVNLK